MAESKYVCLRCQKEFIVDVITVEEACQRGLNVSPVRCPDCQREDVQPLEMIEA